MIGNGQIQPATPEQNKQAEVVLSNIEEFLLDEEVHGAIVQKMGEGEPADTIGQIAGQLVHMQVMVAEGSGLELSREILIAVTGEVVNILIDMGMSAGIIQIQDDTQLEQLQGNAMIVAADTYMRLGDEKVNGQAAMQLTQQAMDGQLDTPDSQQGLINNMPSPTGQQPMVEEAPPQGMPPQEGMPPQQGGLL